MTYRVLWVTNIPIGEAPRLFGLPGSNLGGWLTGLLDMLVAHEGYTLSFAFPVVGKPQCESLSDDVNTYYSFPAGPTGKEPDDRTIQCLERILIHAKPDLVHVFGTELQHAESVMRLCQQRGIRTILQLQGLMGSIAQHDMGWLPDRVTRKGTLAERVLGRTLRDKHKRVVAAAKQEQHALRLAEHIVGRTAYDRAWSKQVNPEALYHHVDENLRASFYEGEWSLENCDRFSLMVSQPSIPYKGAHVAIRALSLIREKHPEVRLSLVGKDPIAGRDPVSLLRRTSYGWYLRTLIKKYRLEEQVTFTGPLDEASMRMLFLKSHIFLSCSSVENESNSVSEAQLLGLPVVASYVGGVPDRVKHAKTGFLYQGDAPYMLASFASEIIESDDLARELSRAARVEARIRHDRMKNAQQMLSVYEKVLHQ